MKLISIVVIRRCDSQEPAVTVKLAVSVIRCVCDKVDKWRQQQQQQQQQQRWASKYLTTDERKRGVGCCVHLLVKLNRQIDENMQLVRTFGVLKMFLSKFSLIERDDQRIFRRTLNPKRGLTFLDTNFRQVLTLSWLLTVLLYLPYLQKSMLWSCFKYVFMF